MAQEPAYRAELRSIGVSEAALDDTDAQYRALGRFHYHFSRVLVTAWASVSTATTPSHRNPAIEKVHKALLEKTAGQAMALWFELCHLIYDHDEPELEVLRWFEAQFHDFNQVRNLLSHGHAWLGYGGRDGVRQRYSRVRIGGPPASDPRLRTVESMDQMTDDLWYFRRRLSEYATAVFIAGTAGSPRLGRVARNLVMRNGRVERVKALDLRSELITGG